MSNWRKLIQTLLPWYDPDTEAKRNARTERIARRSQVARARAERVIAQYRSAEAKAGAAGDALIEQVRR